MKNVKEIKLIDLKQIAKQLNIKNWWTAKKDDLISTIEKMQSASDEVMNTIENYFKEKEAIEEYEKDWRKYTDRHDVNEFLEKWKTGKITFDAAIETHEDNSEDTSEPEHINNQAEQENATEDNVGAQKHVSELKPKRGALIEYNGKSQNIVAWGKELGISANTLYGRLYKLGWSVEKAFAKK